VDPPVHMSCRRQQFWQQVRCEPADDENGADKKQQQRSSKQPQYSNSSPPSFDKTSQIQRHSCFLISSLHEYTRVICHQFCLPHQRQHTIHNDSPRIHEHGLLRANDTRRRFRISAVSFNNWAIFALAAMGAFMTTLDSSIVNFSLPSFARLWCPAQRHRRVGDYWLSGRHCRCAAYRRVAGGHGRAQADLSLGYHHL
jgi:hypothetical protein